MSETFDKCLGTLDTQRAARGNVSVLSASTVAGFSANPKFAPEERKSRCILAEGPYVYSGRIPLTQAPRGGADFLVT